MDFQGNNLKNSLENLRIVLFLISWIGAISSILWISNQNVLIPFGTSAFALFLILTLFRVKYQSLLIILFLLIIYILIIGRPPSFFELSEAGKYIIIFAGLIPTMGLVRATAQKLDQVKNSQELLSKLPFDSLASGFQITAHVLGSVINTGVFAILAAAMPRSIEVKYRKLVAEATLRGMVSSATWSPFFVAFVVGQVYVDAQSAWAGLAVGLLLGTGFSLGSLFLLNKGLNWKQLKGSLACLRPMLSTLSLIIVLVVGSALIFGLTALSAIIIVMPLLVSCYFIKTPRNIAPVLSETIIYLKKNTDDVAIISCAMVIGYFVTNSPEALKIIENMDLIVIPSWSILIFIPTTMTLLSLIGIHPVISSTTLLSIFTTSFHDISPTLIMQAHLLGWCTGTMSSVASLSVITCSSLFQISSFKLCFGINSLVATIFALCGGGTLALANQLANI